MRETGKMIAALSLLGLIAAGPALAQGSTGSTSSPKTTGKFTSKTVENPSAAAKVGAADRSFMRKAAAGGMEEVGLGKLAADRASNPDVKSFGQKMVDDHGKANDKLKQIASDKRVDLPSDLGSAAKADHAKLGKLSGDAFDKAYVKLMVKDHTKDAAEFSHAAKTAKDPDLKQFASDTLAVVQDHLKMAKDLQAKLGGGKKAGGSR